MSTRLRVDAVELATSGGLVHYDFTGPLTVLGGPVGTGKSTLFELIKHALGGRALFSPVAEEHVTKVTVDVSAGSRRLRLSRPTHDRVGRVDIVDLAVREELGERPTENAPGSDEGTVGALLMNAMGLPTDARATSATRRSTQQPSRITFNDVWSYLYVEQPEIDRSIAHHTETYREPKRKTVFELFFGLTDAELLDTKASLRETEHELAEAETEEATVLRFLADARTESRDNALREQAETERELERAQATLQRLHEEADPPDGRTDVLRDLLAATRERSAHAHHELADLERSQEDRRNLAAGIRQDLTRLARVRDATTRLADIEFVVCPRCSQSVRDRDVSPGVCRLCLQSEPPPPESENSGESYEMAQLSAQASEVEELLAAGEQQLTLMRTRLQEITDHADALARAVDERTREFVSPRLTAYADASSTVGKARARLDALEETLRLWDRAADVSSRANDLRVRRQRLVDEVKQREQALQENRELLDVMSVDYQDTIRRLGVPGVQAGNIDKRSYLPIVDGVRFDRISTGGIRTALVVAYWVTLLATALRQPTSLMPTLLILDSPRKSIGEGEALAANLYRQLDVLAETYRDRVQIIVADNGLPAEYSRRWQQFQFDYDRPVVHTVPHPGPASVITLEQMVRSHEASEPE
jgi:hypothetical protein